jgi:hypothetical protein
MRSAKLVIGLAWIGVAMGCSWGYGYGYRRPGYYGGGGYYAGSVAYSQPPPTTTTQEQVVVQGQVTAPNGAVVQTQVGMAPPPAVVGEGIAGSDGTRGWRVVSQAPANDFQRLVQALTRASCQAEANAQGEIRAACAGNVHLIMRFDQQNVYKLCAPGTDPNACTQVWSQIGN